MGTALLDAPQEHCDEKDEADSTESEVVVLATLCNQIEFLYNLKGFTLDRTE